MSRRNIRQEMVSGAISLLAEKGVQGTSFSVVTETTKTPRGSIYHHFPGGKNELIEEAVASLGSVVTFLIDAVDASSPSQVVEQFLENWRALLLANNLHFVVQLFSLQVNFLLLDVQIAQHLVDLGQHLVLGNFRPGAATVSAEQAKSH
jgi:AcrR family transcriptional regulator